MRSPASYASFSLALILWSAAPAAAQDVAPAPPPSCLSDWSCTTSSVRVPLGLYVRSVDAGGRYVTLEDGSLWEVEISDRATTGSWQPDDFVGIRTIAAPRGDFDVLLSRVGDREQRAAARLAGRRNVAFRSTDSLPDDHSQE